MSTSTSDEQRALDLFERLMNELSCALNARAATRAALLTAAEICGARHGTAHVPSGEDFLSLVVQFGFDDLETRQFEIELARVDSVAHRACRTRAIAAIEDFTHEPATEESALAASRGYRAAHSVPLCDTEGRLLFVFTLFFVEPTRVPIRHSQWVRACARQVALLTRRSEGEATQPASEERFRSLFQESNDFIVIADLHQKITYCNPATATALGWPTDYVLGRSIGDFIPPDHFQRTSAMLNQKLREGGSTRYEVEVIARDGRRMTWEINSRLTFGPDGKPTGLHAIGRDMTTMRAAHEELRKSERRLREADQRKDEYLAMLAHELRNPLAPIRTSAHILQQPAATPEQIRQASGILERQVAHITRIVDDLLDVSRLTRGLVAFDMKPISLHDVVNVAVEQVRSLIEAKQHRLTIKLPDEPVVLSGEAVRLVQMISNLLSNAARHAGENLEIELSVVVNVQLVEIHIRDQGIGIAPEFLPHVFDLFAQSERSAARSEGGLGIGLALVRRIAELHGGQVEAHSEGTGRGAHFTVVLPRLANRRAEAEAPSRAQPNTQRPLKILVVDDNRDAADTLSMLLQMDGHTTLVAYDGRTALEQADRERPDVMLLDIGLPGMSGYDLARRLRNTPTTDQAVLIALTGYGQTADQQHSKHAGFDHHLTKPVSAELLREILATVTK